MASINPYAEEKEHFLFAYDAPMAFQIHFCLTITQKTSESIKTNLEITKMGRSPFVVKNGKYRQINLHHSKQNAKGPLFELSSATHQKYKGSNALHPFGNNKHPINPVFHNESWDTDRKAYWRQRAEAEIKARRSKVTCK